MAMELLRRMWSRWTDEDGRRGLLLLFSFLLTGLLWPAGGRTSAGTVAGSGFPAGIDLAGLHRFMPGDDPAWADPAYDDAAWPLLRVPASWQSQGVRCPGGVG